MKKSNHQQIDESSQIKNIEGKADNLQAVDLSRITVEHQAAENSFYSQDLIEESKPTNEDFLKNDETISPERLVLATPVFQSRDIRKEEILDQKLKEATPVLQEPIPNIEQNKPNIEPLLNNLRLGKFVCQAKDVPAPKDINAQPVSNRRARPAVNYSTAF